MTNLPSVPQPSVPTPAPQQPTLRPAEVMNSAPPNPFKPKTNFAPILAAVIISGLVFGLGGYYFGNNQSKTGISPTPQPSSALSPTSIPTVTPTPIPTPAATFPLDWKNGNIASVGLSLKHPPNLAFIPVENNSTTLKADEEYFVAVSGSDIIYLDIFLYKSEKTPMSWWDSEGKNKFDQLETSVEDAMDPKPAITFTYSTKESTWAGKEALEVTVSSDFGSPQTPSKRYLTIVQQKGYIIMISHHEQGTTPPSLPISQQILSSIQFAN